MTDGATRLMASNDPRLLHEVHVDERAGRER